MKLNCKITHNFSLEKDNGFHLACSCAINRINNLEEFVRNIESMVELEKPVDLAKVIKMIRKVKPSKTLE